jgi:hypothetical protein
MIELVTHTPDDAARGNRQCERFDGWLQVTT